ncbi:hypothetical protein V6Z05_14995 [Leptospira venezuelensis]|uniref:hypothetical protein n=1 Tax=Leptospira venezuelensis TaxID=1958811 RepID=UPI000A373162|nr:hypothetical protein [Leptospira venezuelensis]
MKIGKKFNSLKLAEYIFYIDNYKKYTDFNTLGLYRSISENEKLSIEEKIEIREHAHKIFKKTFDFLQIKDPDTFVRVTTLGKMLTVADEREIWANVIANQERILKEKRIRHRNFGEYSKHNCGFDDCIYNGLMVQPGSFLVENNIHFQSDKNRHSQKVKSERFKKERKGMSKILEDGFSEIDENTFA